MEVDIDALHFALKDAEAFLGDKEAQRRDLEEEIERIQAEVRGLELAVARHSQSPVANERPWVSLTRTDAVESVLAEAPGPLGPSEIVEHLTAAGRDDDYTAVSATLAHLQRTDRVHSVGRGQWVSGPMPAEEAPWDAGLTSTIRPDVPPNYEKEERTF